MREYEGRYKAESIPIPQNITVRDGELYTQWGSYPFHRILTPIGRDEFFFRYEYAKVRFARDDKGKIVKMQWQGPGGHPVDFAPVMLK